MPAKATWRDAVLARESGFGETADAEGFNEFLDLAGRTAGTRDRNWHTESYLPEQTAVAGPGRTDTSSASYCSSVPKEGANLSSAKLKETELHVASCPGIPPVQKTRNPPGVGTMRGYSACSEGRDNRIGTLQLSP